MDKKKKLKLFRVVQIEAQGKICRKIETVSLRGAKIIARQWRTEDPTLRVVVLGAGNNVYEVLQ